MTDSPTRSIPPADPGSNQATATLAPVEQVHLTCAFEGPESPTSFPTPDDRYTKQEFLARGGMGEVWTAYDRVLNRLVAVKILREDLKDRMASASRFIEEARITGKLSHPGIPPIHDLGSFRDGRPFIAMKLIKGRTLSDLLINERPDLAELLRIFEHICQAVAAAHDRRVIHRDLKPGNVMVGAFNEVQVMDWGLAKVLGEVPALPDPQAAGTQETRAPVSVIESDRDPSSHTRAGSLLGTPAYMPPEQAKGEIDRTDTRSDVFALGAILCELLTGKPPYWAETAAEIQAYAITAQLGPAFERLDASHADMELVILTRHCLNANPENRPADAKRVADAIKRYRMGVEERLRLAERDRAAAEAKAAEEVNTRREAEARSEEQRKRRRTQFALAFTGMLLLLGAGTGVWWADKQAAERKQSEQEQQAQVDRLQSERQADALRQQVENNKRLQAERDRLARNRQAIESLVMQAENELRSGDAQKAADLLEQIARRSAEGGAESLAARIERCRADQRMLSELDEADEILWNGDDYRNRNAQTAAKWAAAFKRYGFDCEAPKFEEAAAEVNASPIRERLLLALDLWYTFRNPSATDDSEARIRSAAERKTIRKFLDLLDPDPFRNEVRDAIPRIDAATFQTFVNDPEILRQPVRFSIVLGQQQYLPLETRERLLRPALDKAPNDFPLLCSVISMYQNSQRLTSDVISQELRYGQAAVAVRPGNKTAWRYLARSHWDRGHFDDAIRCYRRSLRIDSEDSITLSSLSAVYVRKHDPEAALPFSEKAVRVSPKSALAYNNLGLVYDRLNDVDAALRCYEKAVEFEPTAASYLNNLGYAYVRKNDLARAAHYFREALVYSSNFRLAETNLRYVQERRRTDREWELAPPPRPKRAASRP